MKYPKELKSLFYGPETHECDRVPDGVTDWELYQSPSDVEFLELHAECGGVNGSENVYFCLSVETEEKLLEWLQKRKEYREGREQ